MVMGNKISSVKLFRLPNPLHFVEKFYFFSMWLWEKVTVKAKGIQMGIKVEKIVINFKAKFYTHLRYQK